MMGFHDFFMSALFGLVFACVVAKFVAVVFYGNEGKVKVDVNRDVKVVEHVNLGNALKVRRSKSRKRVTFVDDVVVRHVDQLEFEEGCEEVCEEIKRVVFHGEDGVCGEGLGCVERREGEIVEGKSEKDETFKCFDEQKVEEDGIHLLCNDESNKDIEREIIGEGGVEISDKNLSLEEENVIMGSSTKTIEILKCIDEQRVNEEGKMLNRVEEAFELRDIKQEGDCSVNIDESFCENGDKLLIGGMHDLTIEEKAVKEETLASGSVLEGSMVYKEMNKGFSSRSCVEVIYKHAISEEVLGENVDEVLSKKGTQSATKNEDVLIDEEDDDWEGIERTELEKVFAEAVNYVEYGLHGKDDQSEKLGSEVQMQLYGLHKIAVEGSCHQAQPMALNFSARAKWNAWQKLGSMSPEVAMEEYIKLLTEKFPDWVQHFYDEDCRQSSLESENPHDADHKCYLGEIQPNLLPEPELKPDCVAGSDYLSRGTKVDTD